MLRSRKGAWRLLVILARMTRSPWNFVAAS